MLRSKFLFILPLVVCVTGQVDDRGIGYYGTSNVRDQSIYSQPSYASDRRTMLSPRPIRLAPVYHSASQPPLAAAPQPPVAANPQPPVASAPEPPVAAAPQPPVYAAPQPPVAAAPQPPVAAAPEPPVAAAPQPPVYAAPQPPVAAAPQPPVAAAPQPPVYAAPQPPVAAAPEPPVAAAPQPPVYAAPQPPVAAAPQPPVYAAPQPPVAAAPQPPVAAAPQPPVYAAPQPPVAAAPEPPVAAAPQPPVYAAPQPPVAAAPQPPVYAAPQPTVAAAPQPPVAAAPEPPVAAAPQPPAYAATQPPVAATPQPPVYAAPQPPVYAAPQPPVAAAPRPLPSSEVRAPSPQPQPQPAPQPQPERPIQPVSDGRQPAVQPRYGTVLSSGALPPLLPKHKPERPPAFGRHPPQSNQPTYYPVTQPTVTRGPAVIAPPQSSPRPSGLLRGDLGCNEGDGYYSVENECDTYILCKNDKAVKYVCPDGLHFNPAAKQFEYPCAYPSEVKCNAGAQMQNAIPTNQCPRQYGFFSIKDGDCSKFMSCQDGKANIMTCPAGLVFNQAISSCDWQANVPECNPSVFKDFACPAAPTNEDAYVSDIIYKYRYQKQCRMYIACQRGHPRLLSCDSGLAFDETSQSCIQDDYVQGCSTLIAS